MIDQIPEEARQLRDEFLEKQKLQGLGKPHKVFEIPRRGGYGVIESLARFLGFTVVGGGGSHGVQIEDEEGNYVYSLSVHGGGKDLATGTYNGAIKALTHRAGIEVQKQKGGNRRVRISKE